MGKPKRWKTTISAGELVLFVEGDYELIVLGPVIANENYDINALFEEYNSSSASEIGESLYDRGIRFYEWATEIRKAFTKCAYISCNTDDLGKGNIFPLTEFTGE
jgi:hypothetical protein